MDNPAADNRAQSNPKSLLRRANRTIRQLGIERISYVGRALSLLHGMERGLRSDWRACNELEPEKRVASHCQLVKALDIILDRRRILCGDPLPRGDRSKGAQRMVELEPMVPESVPEPPPVEPGAGPD